MITKPRIEICYRLKYTKETVKVFVNQTLIEPFTVTFWHETCLKGINQTNPNIMKELIRQYENAKKRSKVFMKNGQLHSYFDTLVEMNNYKKMMVVVVAN